AALASRTPRLLRAGQAPADCDTVAATLRLHGLRALPLGVAGSYALTVASLVTRLDGERLAARRQLAGAPTRPEQARAAHGLVAAYAGAAAALARATPTPFTRPSHFALLGALREAPRAYA